jgi:putative transposase
MRIKIFEPLAMINGLCITPSPGRDRGNGPETRPGIKSPKRGDVIPNLPASTRTLAIHGGEEVR